jgi:hypothetical protein
VTYVVHVNRNAIDRNTREGRDDPTITFHDPAVPAAAPQDVHELTIYAQDGRRVGRLLSQPPAKPTHPHRPLVWLELEPGCGVHGHIR